MQEIDERGDEWKQRKELGAWDNGPGEINESDTEKLEERMDSGDAPEVEWIKCELAG